ncbi:hypothetical protein AB0O91_16830 [Kitasatospora sp. NPDC089797]|uniref:hypothetical protein n=1 Tax=Kitasatospora sp. NPDC089797 TaxID=3155298 RepID=UPI00341678C0
MTPGHGVLPHRFRLRVSLLSTVPVLAVAALVLPPLALAGLLPWSVLPAVALAQAVQAALVLHHLGRTRHRA